jgi:hypothetical protein
MLRSGRSIAEHLGLFDDPDMAAFRRVGLPAVVACVACGTSMSILSRSCLVEVDGTVWCRDCAGLFEDEQTEKISLSMLRGLRREMRERT